MKLIDWICNRREARYWKIPKKPTTVNIDLNKDTGLALVETFSGDMVQIRVPQEVLAEGTDATVRYVLAEFPTR